MFRGFMLKEFKLDLVQFLSLPQFALECMLKYTQAEIHHMTEVEDILMGKRHPRWLELCINQACSPHPEPQRGQGQRTEVTNNLH